MSAQQSDDGMDAPDVETENRIVHRARQLCRRAEPHADDAPCPAHRAEARRQLLAFQG